MKVFGSNADHVITKELKDIVPGASLIIVVYLFTKHIIETIRQRPLSQSTLT